MRDPPYIPWKEKHPFKRAYINIKLAFMKFNRKTHGQGLMLIFLTIVLLIYLASRITPTPETELSCMIQPNMGCIWGL